MIAEISASSFDAFFAWAPWVIGLAIYFIFYVAKRHESSPEPLHAVQTFACAECGRTGSREQMVPQNHGGAVGWYCTDCAAAKASAV